MKKKADQDYRIREPHFADDRWYSSNPVRLEADIQNYLTEPPTRLAADTLIGLVAPHAGLFFSGHVAGAGFSSLIAEAYDTVVLIGPDHRGLAPAKISSLDVDAWRTPLGDIPVARRFLDSLQPEIDLKLLTSDEEHALEIELPFLQIVLTQFKLVPLMMGSQALDVCRQLGSALVKAMAKAQSGPTLFVASSDLSHFFDDKTARRLDSTTLQFILNLDAAGLIRHVEAGRRRGEPLACGAGPIATVITAAQALGATQARLLKYATSADVHPVSDRVVGYAAVAITTASV